MCFFATNVPLSSGEFAGNFFLIGEHLAKLRTK